MLNIGDCRTYAFGYVDRDEACYPFHRTDHHLFFVVSLVRVHDAVFHPLHHHSDYHPDVDVHDYL